MPDQYFQDIDLVTLAATGLFVGVQDNGDGTFTDIRVSAQEVLRFMLERSRKLITVADANLGAGNTTLTDPFFASPIVSIAATSQTYLAGIDFTQNTETQTITVINFPLYTDLKILAIA